MAFDAAGQTIDFNYYKEVGASNNGLSTTSGTVSVAIGATTVSGSGTSFTTDFSEGALIKLTSAGSPPMDLSPDQLIQSFLPHQRCDSLLRIHVPVDLDTNAYATMAKR